MTDKIEVYVRTRKIIVGQYATGPVSDGMADHWCFARKNLQKEKTMSESEKQAVEVVSEFAKERDLQVEVCDVSTFKGKLKASANGIVETPTIRIGNNRMTGEKTSHELRSKLESYFNAEVCTCEDR